jgi:23S rRNA pseudouridine1911/1915/1917 synthase
MILEGLVTVNGLSTKAGLKLNSGDKLTVVMPSPASTTLVAEDIPVDILYEDDDLIVIDKPSGLTVHPAPGHPEHTLVNALLSHLPDPDGWDGDNKQRPGIVHRLDRDTSGVMVVAKTAAAHMDLAAQFRARKVNKTYFVLVKGRLAPLDGAIEAPIGRDPSHRERMAVVNESRGRDARTDYHVMEYFDGYTLLEVKPLTGRTHQIRVHLEAIGYPVAGDKVYGVKAPFLNRQFVHAARLGFNMPSTGKYVEFSAPLAPDLEHGLKELRAIAKH